MILHGEEAYGSAAMTAREKYQIGDRISCNCNISHRQFPTGVVVGFGRMPRLVRIMRDGTKTPESWCMDFVDRIGSGNQATKEQAPSTRRSEAP